MSEIPHNFACAFLRTKRLPPADFAPTEDWNRNSRHPTMTDFAVSTIAYSMHAGKKMGSTGLQSERLSNRCSHSTKLCRVYG